MRVYRFLCAKYGIQALRDRRLKISHFLDLNDPYEMAPPPGATRQERTAFREAVSGFSSRYGLLCFSKSWHNPMIWSHYADGHKGVALGFDIPDQLGKTIEYSARRPNCDWQNFKSDSDYALSVIESIYRTKYTHWSYENEIRYIMKMKEPFLKGSIELFDMSSDLQLKEVIFGHRFTAPPAKDGGDFTTICKGLIVKKARIAFETFQVVTRKDWRFPEDLT